MQLVNIIFWTLIILGVFGIILSDVVLGKGFARVYTIALQCYLLGFTAFLVLKRVFFYRLKGNINIIKLVRNSDWQQRLLLQGGVLALLFLTYVYAHGNLMSFDSIMIGILLFYYGTQVMEHGRPSIYLDDRSFSYDDYVVQQWPWRYLRQIELEKEQLRLVGQTRDFELDFESIDDIDFVRLNDELERKVLDGEFASDRSSSSLKDIIHNYARANDILIRSEQQPGNE